MFPTYQDIIRGKEWQRKLGQRLAGLDKGQYILTLTITKDGAHWTVVPLGKVENVHDTP